MQSRNSWEVWRNVSFCTFVNCRPLNIRI